MQKKKRRKTNTVTYMKYITILTSRYMFTYLGAHFIYLSNTYASEVSKENRETEEEDDDFSNCLK